MSRESTGQRAEQAATQLLAFGRRKTIEEVIAKIEAVDAAKVSDLASQIFAGAPTFAASGAVDTLPPEAQIREWLAA